MHCLSSQFLHHDDDNDLQSIFDIYSVMYSSVFATNDSISFDLHSFLFRFVCKTNFRFVHSKWSYRIWQFSCTKSFLSHYGNDPSLPKSFEHLITLAFNDDKNRKLKSHSWVNWTFFFWIHSRMLLIVRYIQWLLFLFHCS